MYKRFRWIFYFPSNPHLYQMKRPNERNWKWRAVFSDVAAAAIVVASVSFFCVIIFNFIGKLTAYYTPHMAGTKRMKEEKKSQSTFTIAWYWFDAIRKNINGRKSLNFFCSFRWEREEKGRTECIFLRSEKSFFSLPILSLVQTNKKKSAKDRSEKWESMKNETHCKLNESTKGNKWKWKKRNEKRREERTEIHRVKWRVLIEYGRFFPSFFLASKFVSQSKLKTSQFSSVCSLAFFVCVCESIVHVCCIWFNGSWKGGAYVLKRIYDPLALLNKY